MKKNIQILCSTLLLFSSLTQAKEIKTQTLNNTMYNTYPIEGKILLPSNLVSILVKLISSNNILSLLAIIKFVISFVEFL